MEALEEPHQVLMTLPGDPPGPPSMKPVLQEQQLLVEVVDGVAPGLLVGGETSVQDRPDAGLVDEPPPRPSVRKGPRDSHGADRVEAVGVLNDPRLQRA